MTDWERDHQAAGVQESAGTFTVTGSGDIAPLGASGGQPVERALSGVPIGLIVLAVVAVMFISAEYRWGLIHTTVLASPRRGRVLAAKAVVVATVTFVAGLAGAGVAVWLGRRILRANGNVILRADPVTELRVVVGSAALLAVTAVLAVALGAVFRRGTPAVTAVVTLIVLPYLLATTSVLPTAAAQWLLRVTPAAGFAVQQSIPPYPQVIENYSPSMGYYPLPPWAGFIVLCGYAAFALTLASHRLRHRDV